MNQLLLNTEKEAQSGGKGHQEVSSPASCPKQGQLWDEPRLLRAFFIALENSKEKTCTDLLGNLLRYLTVLIVKKFFLHPV